MSIPIGRQGAGPNITIESMKKVAAEEQLDTAATQENTAETLLEENSTSTVAGLLKQASKPKLGEETKTEKITTTGDIKSRFVRKDPTDSFQDFLRDPKNQQYGLPDTLPDVLRKVAGIVRDTELNPESPPEVILAKVVESMTQDGVPPTNAQVHKALEYFEVATRDAPDSTLHDKLDKLKNDFKTTYKESIEAGDRSMSIAYAMMKNGVLPAKAITAAIAQQSDTAKIAQASEMLEDVFEKNPETATGLYFDLDKQGLELTNIENYAETLWRFMNNRFKTTLNTKVSSSAPDTASL